jgi:hypothetical protein
VEAGLGLAHGRERVIILAGRRLRCQPRQHRYGEDRRNGADVSLRISTRPSR